MKARGSITYSLNTQISLVGPREYVQRPLVKSLPSGSPVHPCKQSICAYMKLSVDGQPCQNQNTLAKE